MNLKRLIQASLMGLVLTAPFVTQASAQSVLRVLQGATSNNISVSVNRAVVMEADRPFAELSVANPGIADIATLGERTIYVLGKAPGRTTLTILGQEGELITNVEVQVSPDIAEFKERLQDIMPGEPIEVRTANDGIVLSGRVSGARKVSRALELAERYAPGRVTNLMMVGGTQQVMLKVRFAEMTRSVSKGLQNSLNVFGLGGNNLRGNAFSGRDFINEGDLGDPTDNLIVFDENTVGAFNALATIGDVTIDLLLEAFESKGMVRTLAEPNLVALSGEASSFLAGGEFPVPVQDEEGFVRVEFKPFGVELDFIPTVVDGDLINLEVATSVSQIDTATQVADFPAISTRRANTVVEMRDGESFAIAGLLQDDFTDDVGQVPWLGDVPILGALFRSSDFARRQSELVIIITPHLVTPTDGDALALPTDRMRLPSERELFLQGRTTGSTAVQDIARQDFQGSYGYVME